MFSVAVLPTQGATLSVLPGQSYWPVCIPVMEAPL